MGFLSKILGGETASSSTGRTAKERARRNREIRAIDARTATWLRNGGLDPKKRSR